MEELTMENKPNIKMVRVDDVTAHGGKIEVGDNTPNGSIFTVTL